MTVSYGISYIQRMNKRKCLFIEGRMIRTDKRMDKPLDQGRIQELILGGPNQGPQSKVKGEAQIEGAKRPSIEGEVLNIALFKKGSTFQLYLFRARVRLGRQGYA